MGLQKAWLSLVLCLFLSPVHAQEKVSFKTQKINVGSKQLKVWIADNDKKRSQGMMFKSSWTSGVEGMLFVFDGESRRSFWMRNTLLPLSLGFFNSKGVLLEIASMNPPKSLAQVKVDRVLSTKAAKYVLEVPKGWFKKKSIKVDAKLKLF